MSRNPLHRLILAVTLLALLAPGLAEARSRKPMNDTQSFAAQQISERGFFTFVWDLFAVWTGSTGQAKNGGMLDPFGQNGNGNGNGNGTGTGGGTGTGTSGTSQIGAGDDGDNGGMLDPHG